MHTVYTFEIKYQIPKKNHIWVNRSDRYEVHTNDVESVGNFWKEKNPTFKLLSVNLVRVHVPR